MYRLTSVIPEAHHLLCSSSPPSEVGTINNITILEMTELRPEKLSNLLKVGALANGSAQIPTQIILTLEMVLTTIHELIHSTNQQGLRA